MCMTHRVLNFATSGAREKAVSLFFGLLMLFKLLKLYFCKVEVMIYI